MGFLSPNDRITMNRDRLLADAKKLLLDISEGYVPPEPRTYSLPGVSGKAALQLAVNDLALSGKVTPHDIIVTNALAEILSGGNTDVTELLQEDDILAMEKKTIAKLAKNTDTLDRMQHMLETGKPLRN